MKVKKLFDKFICDFNAIYVFENNYEVEAFCNNKNFELDITLQCIEKYGDKVVSDWYYNGSSNCLNINYKLKMDEEV